MVTLRKFAQATLRRLDIDGVYLTPDQARTLNQAIGKLQFVAPYPGPLSEMEATTVERFRRRVWEQR